jgi:hypothetical protein
MTAAAELTEPSAARAPRVGSRGSYQFSPDSIIGFTVTEIEGNLCYCDYDNGRKGPFIWRFKDGLNNLHDWPGKPKNDVHSVEA